MKYLIFIFVISLSLASCHSGNRFNESKGNLSGPHIFNPFTDMDFGHHKIYLIGAAFVILFVFIKLGSETEFNYCFLVGFRNCEYERRINVRNICRKKCLKHKTTAGSIFPESAFLVTSGIIPAAILLGLGIRLEGALNPNIVFNFLLIPIILSAGWNTDKITFYNNVGTILWFAIVGTIVNAAILIPFFYYGSKHRWGIFHKIDMDLVDSGMYAVLICAVDPVAVLSVFEAMHIDKLVYGVVFGESLLNDGVAVVFYKAFESMHKYKDNIRFVESVGIIFVFFIYAFCMSVILAVIMAVIISLTTKLFYHHQPMQFVVILSMNYLTYIIGDSIKGSGILSLYFCVLLQRQYVQANLTYTTNTIVVQLFNQLALLSEGVIFILMGLTSFSPTGISANTDIGFSLFLIFICYLSRYVVVYALGFLVNQVRHEKLDYKKNLFIQSHGGLRGAIGFSLALAIDDKFDNKYYYQSATAIMVFFSVYIVGATIKPLARLCKIPIESHEEKTIFVSLQDKVLDRTRDGIKVFLGATSMRFKWEKKYRYLNNRYMKRWLMAGKAIERNVSHSSVVKLYHHQSISEAQSIAGSHGSLIMKDALKANGDARIQLYKRAWNSYVSLDSLKSNGRNNDDMYGNMSIPDMSMLDQIITRRDVDDQMTHHNRQEGIGRKFKKVDSIIIDNKKLKNKLKVNVDNHRSHNYKHSARVIEVKSKNSHKSSHDILAQMQKTYNNVPKLNKSVTFDGTFVSVRRPIFDFGDQNLPLSESIHHEKVIFTIAEEKPSDEGFSNGAYDLEDNSLLWTTYDPFAGILGDVGTAYIEPPWLRLCDSKSPERSHEPIIPGKSIEQVPHHLLLPEKTDPRAARRKNGSTHTPSLSPNFSGKRPSNHIYGLPILFETSQL